MTGSTDDDRRLIEAAQADPGRFVDLYERYVDRVYTFVSCRAQNRAVAEDITSHVFEKALAELHRFEWRGTPFVAWLFRIAANALADHWRQDARESHDLHSDVPDARDSEQIERRVMLFQLVGRLPEMQRQVIEMRFVEQKSIRDIAAALGRSEGAVKQLQLRALENLRSGMVPHE